MQKGFCMKSSLEIKYERLAKYVMESKEFERKMFYAVAVLYVFIFAHSKCHS